MAETSSPEDPTIQEPETETSVDPEDTEGTPLSQEEIDLQAAEAAEADRIQKAERAAEMAARAEELERAVNDRLYGQEKVLKDEDGRILDVDVAREAADAQKELIDKSLESAASKKSKAKNKESLAYRETERAANEKASEIVKSHEGERDGGCAIGRELMAKWDSAHSGILENAPVGKWEKAKFFLGGGKERGAAYREAKSEFGKAEAAKTLMERSEGKYLKMGAEAKDILSQIDGDEGLSPMQKKILEKKAATLLIKATKERAFIEDRVHPKAKELAGLTSAVEKEQGMQSEQIKFATLMEDYPEKAEILNEIAARVADPAELLKNMMKIGSLTEENTEKFIAEQANKIGRDFAEKIVESGLLDVLYAGKMEEGIDKFNARELFTIIDQRKKAGIAQRSSEVGLKRQEKVSLMKQGWQKLGRNIGKFAKGVGAASVGIEIPKGGLPEGVEATPGQEIPKGGVMNMEGIDYDTPIRDIIERGSNEYALLLQGVRILHNMGVPDSPSAITGPLFWTEDKLQLPARLIPVLERSVLIRRWEANLELRRNNSGRRTEQKIERINGVLGSFLEILGRRNTKRASNTGGEGGATPAPAA
jgi:hypothetical protein